MNENQQAEISKFLSYILRHEPQAIGLHLDVEGWADIESLIMGAAKTGRILDSETIKLVVACSDKKRFLLSSDGKKIRAVQGHSTPEVNIIYVDKVPPEILYHGTAARFIESILQEGLIPGSRKHVHLSEDIKTAAAVGSRYGKPVVLKIKSLQMQQQGYKFFQAENHVWLTEHVPVSYIDKD